MSDARRRPQRPAQRAGRAGRASTPGRARNPVIKVHDLAWLEFEKPDLDRAEAFAHARSGSRTVLRTADELQLRGTDAGRAVRDHPPRHAVAVRRCRRSGRADAADVAAAGRARPGATRRDAAGEPRRGRGGPDRPERGSGPRRRRHRTSWPRCPRQQPHTFNFGHELRARQRHAAPAARARQGAAARARRAADHQVPRDAELVPRAPRADRQRLPVLPGPARARPGDELHPLRPRLDPDRPPHAGDGAGPVEPLRALRLPGRATSTRWPRAASTCASRATTARGGSAGTSRAARSSTTGAIPTGSWSSTSPTATCSTTPSSRAGRR